MSRPSFLKSVRFLQSNLNYKTQYYPKIYKVNYNGTKILISGENYLSSDFSTKLADMKQVLMEYRKKCEEYKKKPEYFDEVYKVNVKTLINRKLINTKLYEDGNIKYIYNDGSVEYKHEI